MNCNFDKEIIQKYVDNTIEPLELIVLKEHIAVCEDCKLELKLMSKLEDSMQEYFVNIPDNEALDKFSMEILNQCYQQNEYSYREGLAKAWEINKTVFKNASKYTAYIPGSKLASSTAKKLGKGICKSVNSYAKNGVRKLIEGTVK